MLERKKYAQIVREQINSGQIKIFTGMYRCGKSTILKMVGQMLRRQGVPMGDIVSIDFEAGRHSEIRDGGSLLFVVRNLVKEKERMYLLLDEIGNLPGWEKALTLILEQYNCDVYLTGTRASLWNGQLEELLAGKYLEIPVYPYNYREFSDAVSENALLEEDEILQHYMRCGNMPGIHKVEQSTDTIFSYLLDVCQAGILQNVVRPCKLRNVDQIWMILGCVSENLGRPLSAKTAAQILKEEGYAIGKDTVYVVLRALTEAGILQKVPRYDRKSQRALEAQEKYYFTDWGMYHSLHGIGQRGKKALIENIVCMELLSRGWEVYRTQYRETPIDFLAQKKKTRIYLQIREKTTASEAAKMAALLPSDGKGTVIALEPLAEAEDSSNVVSLLEFLREEEQ